MTDYRDDAKPDWFAVGQRVESHPATDAWRRGDRFGQVTKIGRAEVMVEMDRSGRDIRFDPSLIGLVA